MNKLNTPKVLTLLSVLSLSANTAWPQAARDAGTPQPSPNNPSNAQSTAATENSSSGMDDDETVLLDPFTVTIEHEGYKAVDTLAGGRVRTTLKDTPAALSVVTKKLMDDLGVTSAEDLLVYTANTEVAGLSGNFSGMAARGSGLSFAEGSRMVNPGSVNRARGLSGMDNTRNYMPSDIPWDGFNISRVDISRGPNSFLFGVGSPSGISNVSTNEAQFTDKGSFEARIGSFDSTRESLDFNKVILPKELALRVDLVNDETAFRQKPAFSHAKRGYGALRYEPKFLRSDSAYTKIQASFENGRVKSNNPRMIPPIDYITGYLSDPNASKTGYNAWTYRLVDNQPDISVSPWSSNGSLANANQWSDTPNYYWDAATGQVIKAAQGTYNQQPPGGGGYLQGTGLSNNVYHINSRGFSNYAKAINYREPNVYRGAYAGTVTYFDQTLGDRSLFDFQNKLIDGTNKGEWQRWNATNVTVVQSLFSNRLVIQAVADRQEYHNGSIAYLGGGTPTMTLDLDSHLLMYPSWLPQGQTNPNLGRPMIYGNYGKGEENTTKRDNYQVTGTWDLNIERDFGIKGLLGRILGHHDITALGSRNTHERSNESYRLHGIDPAFTMTHLGKTKLNQNDMNWLAYIGPNLLGKTGAGADLSHLAHSIAPTAYPMTVYRPVWNAGTSVDPTAPWSYTIHDGSTVTQTQAQNPANYMGYVGLPTGLLNSTDHRLQLRGGSSMNEQRITSKAFMYQGHFWDNTIIPSFGWRRDTTRQRGNVALQDPITGFYPKLTEITDEGVEATVTSKSYGVALHLPPSVKKNLPPGTDLSFYYFHGSNETPKVRYGIDGSQLGNETGETDDYSVQVDALDGRFTARLTYFKTVSKGAAASYGQPLGSSVGWKIDAIPSWTLGFAASALAARDAAASGTPLPSDFPTWMTDWGTSRPEVLAQIESAMKSEFINLFPQSFWDQYGYTVDVEAIKRGDWMNVTTSNTWPSPWTLGGSGNRIHGEYATITQDVEAKGYELELTFRPLRNWDITLNGSKADAQQTGLGEAAGRYLNGMAEMILKGPIGKVAMWGGYSEFGATKQDFLQNLWAPYLQQVALTGTDQPEWRKIRLNIISNYRFENGFLKGLNVGGAFRWMDKAIAGYGIHEADVFGEKAWIADVNQPIYGPAEEHVDLWVGYERRLTPRINWRIQLNVRNVLENPGLTPVTYQPDGTVAQSRISEGQTYELTTKFMF